MYLSSPLNNATWTYFSNKLIILKTCISTFGYTKNKYVKKNNSILLIISHESLNDLYVSYSDKYHWTQTCYSHRIRISVLL